MPDWTYFDPATRRARQHISAPREPEPIAGLVGVPGRWPAEEYRLGEDGQVVLDPVAAAPAAPTAALVKREAARRLAFTDWMVLRATEGGTPVPDAVTAQRTAIRAASNALEAMEPIPADYGDDRWWA